MTCKKVCCHIPNIAYILQKRVAHQNGWPHIGRMEASYMHLAERKQFTCYAGGMDFIPLLYKQVAIATLSTIFLHKETAALSSFPGLWGLIPITQLYSKNGEFDGD